MKFDPNKVIFKTKIISASGLNLTEFQRVIRQLYTMGKGPAENYNIKITKTVEEPKSRYMVHVIYIWRKDSEGDILLNIRYVKKLRSKKKVTKWGREI